MLLVLGAITAVSGIVGLAILPLGFVPDFWPTGWYVLLNLLGLVTGAVMVHFYRLSKRGEGQAKLRLYGWGSYVIYALIGAHIWSTYVSAT